MNKLLALDNFKAKGFSLIEILVTFVVLSVGLLGLAALHANGLKNNQSAYWRSQATILAYNIIDSMRTNRSSALNEDYDISFDEDEPSGGSIADQDLKYWKSLLVSLLPIGDGSIDCDSVTSICTVTVSWDDSIAIDGDNNQQLEIITQL
jgi:type IV pilus assembly protein PilV